LATDATGTPTAKGIRKYNPDADAPSGVGFNGAMDDIDALLDKAQYSTDTKGTNKVAVWNGSAWVYSQVSTAMVADAPAARRFLASDDSNHPAWAAGGWHVIQDTLSPSNTGTGTLYTWTNSVLTGVTAAINRINIFPPTSGSWLAGSRFTLYGIG
jgi:hypothetical protein